MKWFPERDRNVTYQELNSVQVTFCGVGCGFGSADDNRVRAHTAEPDKDGDTHDGEPWYGKRLYVGDRPIWDPGSPGAYAHIQVTRLVQRLSDGQIWVGSQDLFKKGEDNWNELEWFVAATKMGEATYVRLVDVEPVASYETTPFGVIGPDRRIGTGPVTEFRYPPPCVEAVELREQRIRRGVSLGQFARALGRQPSDISALDRGQKRPAMHHDWKELFRELGCIKGRM